MTLIVGVISKSEEQIVLASDSQNTSGISKKNGQKIHKVDFLFSQMLIAESGNSELSGAAIERIREIARATTIDDYQTPARIAADAIREIRKQVYAAFPATTTTPENFNEYWIKNCDFSLVLAYFCAKKPRLFKISSSTAVGNQHLRYATAGCGEDLAQFFMEEWFPDALGDEAVPLIAFYIVEKTKQHINGCGGATQMSIIMNRSSRDSTYQFPPKTISSLSKSLASRDESLRKEFSQSLRLSMISGVLKDSGFESDYLPPEDE